MAIDSKGTVLGLIVVSIFACIWAVGNDFKDARILESKNAKIDTLQRMIISQKEYYSTRFDSIKSKLDSNYILVPKDYEALINKIKRYDKNKFKAK